MPRVSEQHVDARRQQIIDAAYRCFARKGFHHTSMRDIFAEAELSPGAVYNYFKSKDDIIEASFVVDYQRSVPLFESAMDDPNPATAILGLLDFFFAGAESAAALGADRVNIQGWGEALFNPKLMTPLRDTLLTLQNQLAQLIRRGQASANVDASIDPQSMAAILISSYLGLYLQKAILPDLGIGPYRDAFVALLRGSFASAFLNESATS